MTWSQLKNQTWQKLRSWLQQVLDRLVKIPSRDLLRMILYCFDCTQVQNLTRLAREAFKVMFCYLACPIDDEGVKERINHLGFMPLMERDLQTILSNDC